MLALILAILIAVLDQATKAWVREALLLGEVREWIPGMMNLTYVRNTGAAWGLFGGHNLVLGLISTVVMIALIIFRRYLLEDNLTGRLALGFLCGGILGNLFDRIRHGWVTDFLDFHFAGWHWPAFNVADAAICIGVALYLLSSFNSIRRERGRMANGEAAGSE